MTPRNKDNVLAISYLFPNRTNKNYGIFVLNRLKAVSKCYGVKVINPIPWFPFSTLLRRYEKNRNIPDMEIVDGIEVYYPRFFSIPRYLKIIEPITLFITLLPLVWKISRNYSFKIIDVHWLFPDLPAARWLAIIFQKKLIATLRGREALFSTGQWMFENIMIPSLNRTDHIVSLSDEMKTICVNSGVAHENFSIIRNGADVRKYFFMERDEAIEKLGLPSDEKIILSVGSLIYRKGFDRIIKSLKNISRRHPEIKLYIVGSTGPEGAYDTEIKQLIEQFSVSDKVVLLGALPNEKLPLWYNAADVFCLASRGEGSPNVLSEALTCGCPSVATDVGAANEILSHQWMGQLVPNEDDKISSGLLNVLSKNYDRSKIARHMAQFDWDWCAQQVVTVYNAVLEEKG